MFGANHTSERTDAIFLLVPLTSIIYSIYNDPWNFDEMQSILGDFDLT